MSEDEKSEDSSVPPDGKTGGPKRPNAEYALSPKSGGDKIVYYYSREKRLANASPSVKALYDEPKKRTGFLRSLTATKPLATLFASILILSVFIVVLSIFGGAENSYTLGGNRVTVSGVKFEDATYLVLNKKSGGKNVYTGLVDIAVAPEVKKGEEGTEYPVFRHRIFFSLKEEEEYRFSVPFEADRLVMIIQGEKTSVEFVVIPK